ncbi:hypothetical protein [Aquipuribacter nitratireducens]|uniref:Lipocalin-like domain-containing protein n=1 Tax=Aquipuribacter nitratireducens TaxID=650104 RepID=A0ABW0GIM5_9MICO
MTDTDVRDGQTTNIADFGREMWSFLTGKGARIDYTFVDMTVEVPRETGPQSPRAVWKLDGTLRITTQDNDGGGASPA